MALGPGKYDDLRSYLRAEAGLTDDSNGGVIVIVVGGKHGNGFSCQADIRTTRTLPDILEDIARQIRDDGIA